MVPGGGDPVRQVVQSARQLRLEGDRMTRDEFPADLHGLPRGREAPREITDVLPVHGQIGQGPGQGGPEAGGMAFGHLPVDPDRCHRVR